MHKLARLVRFSVNPFLASESIGYNSYASKPPGEGLSIFFELCVELAGEVELATGFVVNVLDIDKAVRDFVVPTFVARIKEDFQQGRHVSLAAIAELLRSARSRLSGRFGTAKVDRLSLTLNPFRKVALDSEDSEMIYFSEKFEFAAMHKLWNSDFSDERNLEVFGKCANPTGHGHNYIIEVTVSLPEGKNGLRIGKFERIVDDGFVKLVDHKNLNVDVAELSKVIPTVENVVTFAWNRLAGKFGEAVLHCLTVWETDKTYCSYYG